MLDGSKFNWERFTELIKESTRFINSAIDINQYPLEKIKDITFTGDIALDFTVDYSWDWFSQKLIINKTELKFVGTVNAQMTAAIASRLGLDDIRSSMKLPGFPLGTIVILVGPVPVPIVLYFQPSIVFKASSPSITISDLTVGGTVMLEAGAAYAGGVVSPVTSIKFTPIFKCSVDVKTTFDFSLDLNGYIISKICGVAGPGLGIAPGAYLQLDILTLKPKIEGGLSAKINGIFDFDFFGLQFDQTYTFFDKKYPLFQHYLVDTNVVNSIFNTPPEITIFKATNTKQDGKVPLDVVLIPELFPHPIPTLFSV